MPRMPLCSRSLCFGIAAAGICLILAGFLPRFFWSASPNVTPATGAAPSQLGNDDFTVSTTDELISVETWRSPYAVLISVAVLIFVSLYAHRRFNRAGP